MWRLFSPSEVVVVCSCLQADFGVFWEGFFGSCQLQLSPVNVRKLGDAVSLQWTVSCQLLLLQRLPPFLPPYKLVEEQTRVRCHFSVFLLTYLWTSVLPLHVVLCVVCVWLTSHDRL